MSEPISDLAIAVADVLRLLRSAKPEDRRAYLAAISRACREEEIDPDTAADLAHLLNVRTQ